MCSIKSSEIELRRCTKSQCAQGIQAGNGQSHRSFLWSKASSFLIIENLVDLRDIQFVWNLRYLRSVQCTIVQDQDYQDSQWYDMPLPDRVGSSPARGPRGQGERAETSCEEEGSREEGSREEILRSLP